MSAELEQKLRDFGKRDDDAIPLVHCLLMLGSLEAKDKDITPYTQHLIEMHAALKQECIVVPFKPSDDLLAWRLARLNAVLRTQFLYDGDQDDYDQPELINLLKVIDRRKGIPVALGVLYIDLAISMDWPIFGLNFPGHFLLRLENGGQRLIFDPFYDGHAVNAAEMRQLLKTVLGPRAELHHNYNDAVTNRDVILRFYNNRKTRFITKGQYADALLTLTHQMWIAPNEARLYFEAGVMATKLDHIRLAMDYLYEFTQISDDAKTVSEAREMIYGLQRLLQ